MRHDEVDLDTFVPVSGQYECFLTCYNMNLNTVNVIIMRYSTI